MAAAAAKWNGTSRKNGLADKLAMGGAHMQNEYICAERFIVGQMNINL